MVSSTVRRHRCRATRCRRHRRSPPPDARRRIRERGVTQVMTARSAQPAAIRPAGAERAGTAIGGRVEQRRATSPRPQRPAPLGAGAGRAQPPISSVSEIRALESVPGRAGRRAPTAAPAPVIRRRFPSVSGWRRPGRPPGGTASVLPAVWVQCRGQVPGDVEDVTGPTLGGGRGGHALLDLPPLLLDVHGAAPAAGPPCSAAMSSTGQRARCAARRPALGPAVERRRKVQLPPVRVDAAGPEAALGRAKRLAVPPVA
jgi:hypothetical protein